MSRDETTTDTVQNYIALTIEHIRCANDVFDAEISNTYATLALVEAVREATRAIYEISTQLALDSRPR